MDETLKVFKSESRLYGDEKFNHRNRKANKDVYSELLQCNSDSELLLAKLVNGATSMRKKLKSYAKDHLPGGKYWDPPSHIVNVLQQVQPSNDICESILGLNDWLQNSLPGVSQLTKRNLIETKKNKSLQWI